MAWKVLSKTDHLDIAISDNRSFSFAQDQILAPVCSFDLQKAVNHLPAVFGKTKKGVELFSLMGVEAGKNLCINANGQWAYRFLPASLEVYPFRVGHLENGERVALLLEDNNVLVNRENGRPLFEKDGSETKLLQQYKSLLARINRSNEIMSSACEIIVEFDLLEPFSIKAKKDSGHEIEFDGMLRINQQALSNLDGKKFLKLRKHNSLELIYGHFFSLTCIERLITVAIKKDPVNSNMKDLGVKIFDDGNQELNFDFS